MGSKHVRQGQDGSVRSVLPPWYRSALGHVAWSLLSPKLGQGKGASSPFGACSRLENKISASLILAPRPPKASLS